MFCPNLFPDVVRVVLHAGEGDRVHAHTVQLLGRGCDGPAHELTGALELFGTLIVMFKWCYT